MQLAASAVQHVAPCFFTERSYRHWGEQHGGDAKEGLAEREPAVLQQKMSANETDGSASTLVASQPGAGVDQKRGHADTVIDRLRYEQHATTGSQER